MDGGHSVQVLGKKMNELLVKNGTVYSYIFEGYHAIKLQKADVYIEDGLITEIKAGIRGNCETIDASGCIVLPGMVNMGASTFAARITSGLLWDWRKGKSRVAPMLDLAAEMFTEDEICAAAMLGLWETVSGGAVTVAELFRAQAERNEHPLRYRAAPESLLQGMSRAAEMLGICLFKTGEDSADFDSAVSCEHLGVPYEGLNFIKSGAKMTMGTGCFGNCMISEMRAVACAVKQQVRDAGGGRASDVFYSATVVNGRAVDGEKYGRVGPGFIGNLSVVCMDRFAPLSYPLAQYIYGAHVGDVRHVVCGGVVLKRDFKPADHLVPYLASADKTAETAILRLWEEARRVIL